MKTKKCAVCKKVLEATLDNFYKCNNRGKYGLKSRCKDCYKIMNKEKYAKNKEYHREYCKNWHQENKKSVHKRQKAYRGSKEGRAIRASSESRRRTRKFTQAQFQMVGNRDLITKIYQYCPDGYDVDHMRALSRGGDHHESNLCYLPSNINYSKGVKSIEEFGEERFNEHVLYWQDIIGT